eukprot:COSAG02_NODE_4428_length_5372_cov_3.099185_3_plen_123_part_00
MPASRPQTDGAIAIAIAISIAISSRPLAMGVPREIRRDTLMNEDVASSRSVPCPCPCNAAPCNGRLHGVENGAATCHSQRYGRVVVVLSRSPGAVRTMLISILVCEKNQRLGAVRGVFCIDQ